MAIAKKLKVKKDRPEAILPARPSEGSAWIDLFADMDVCIWPGDRALVSTGVSIALPANTSGMICSHTGKAAKHGLAIAGGSMIVSGEYRGSIKIPIENNGIRNQWIRIGDRIGRLLVLPAVQVEVEKVDDFEDRLERIDPPADDVITRAEKDLRNYEALKVAAMYGDGKAGGTVERIDRAMEVIAEDPYHDIIRLYYVRGCSREEIAEMYETSVTTVSRNKARLIEKISRIICPTEI